MHIYDIGGYIILQIMRKIYNDQRDKHLVDFILCKYLRNDAHNYLYYYFRTEILPYMLLSKYFYKIHKMTDLLPKEFIFGSFKNIKITDKNPLCDSLRYSIHLVDNLREELAEHDYKLKYGEEYEKIYRSHLPKLYSKRRIFIYFI